MNQLFYQFKNLVSFVEVKRCRRLRISPNAILFPVIWITNRCNLRCKMCDQWKTDPARFSAELSTRGWYSFVDSASRLHAAVITITGGEPLLREDIFDIIKYIRQNRIVCHLCTNGTLLNGLTVNKLKDSRLNSISVSLDSDCAEIHNDIRGVDCFDNVVKGVRLLRRIIPEIKIGINYVITKLNFRNMDRMFSFAESLKVDQIKFDPIHTNLMHREKPLSSFEGLLFNKDDLAELNFEVNKLINAALKTKLLTNSHTFMKRTFHLYNNGWCHTLQCYAGYISCAVDAFGYVSPCDNFDGNESLQNKSLKEIWNSRHFQQLRKLVDNCSSQCWDTTHAELNIRCSKWGFIGEFNQIFKELKYYLVK